jgi:hypothetical protein
MYREVSFDIPLIFTVAESTSIFVPLSKYLQSLHEISSLRGSGILDSDL